MDYSLREPGTMHLLERVDGHDKMASSCRVMVHSADEAFVEFVDIGALKRHTISREEFERRCSTRVFVGILDEGLRLIDARAFWRQVDEIDSARQACGLAPLGVVTQGDRIRRRWRRLLDGMPVPTRLLVGLIRRARSARRGRANNRT